MWVGSERPLGFGFGFWEGGRVIVDAAAEAIGASSVRKTPESDSWSRSRLATLQRDSEREDDPG